MTDVVDIDLARYEREFENKQKLAEWKECLLQPLLDAVDAYDPAGNMIYRKQAINCIRGRFNDIIGELEGDDSI